MKYFSFCIVCACMVDFHNLILKFIILNNLTIENKGTINFLSNIIQEIKIEIYQSL